MPAGCRPKAQRKSRTSEPRLASIPAASVRAATDLGPSLPCDVYPPSLDDYAGPLCTSGGRSRVARISWRPPPVRLTGSRRPALTSLKEIALATDTRARVTCDVRYRLNWTLSKLVPVVVGETPGTVK